MAITMCGPQCTTEQKNSGGRCGDPQVEFVGAVLCTYEINGSWDSDFVALVWDETQQRCRRIEYATTRGWTYHNHASVDADAAVQAKARLSMRDKIRQYVVGAAAEEAATIRVGDIVRSTTTRGKNKGVVGKVRRIEVDPYKRSSFVTYHRYAVEVIGEDSYRMLTQVEKVDAPKVDVEAAHAQADSWLAIINWRSIAQFC